MNIVMDSHVLLLALFFGGHPRQILEAVMQGNVAAYATREIIEEYEAAIAKMASRKRRKLPRNFLLPFISHLHIVKPSPHAAVCSDPNDDKFISCAVAANALYIVNDEKEVLVEGPGRAAKVISAEGFCLLLTLCA